MKRETKYPYIMVDSEGVVQNIAMFDVMLRKYTY